ncbi:MAG: GNAT family N-acetyltransferase [Armatimonadota bacterium]
MSTTEVRVEKEMRGKSCYFWINFEGKDVSRLWVHDLDIRFGDAIVRMGGIGGVETDEAYRKRGFARRLLETANEYMRENGFDIAGLFGISDFYERWGYIPALPEYRLKIPTDNLKNAKMKHAVVEYSDQYKLDALRIYECNNRYRICSIVRYPESWSGFVRGTDWFVEADVKVFVDESGKVIGYLSLDKVKDRTAVAEVGYATQEVFESMAAFLFERAKEHGHEEVILLIPPDHEFAIYLRRYGCTATQVFHRSGGGMMRIINLGSLMTKLSPELSRRMAEAWIFGREFEKGFAIVTDIGNVLVKVKGDKVEVSPVPNLSVEEKLELSQGKLTQLLTGYQTIDILVANQEAQCSPTLIPLLRVLFPPNYPYIWWADRF